jgi:predicted metalloprotease
VFAVALEAVVLVVAGVPTGAVLVAAVLAGVLVVVVVLLVVVAVVVLAVPVVVLAFSGAAQALSSSAQAAQTTRIVNGLVNRRVAFIAWMISSLS